VIPIGYIHTDFHVIILIFSGIYVRMKYSNELKFRRAFYNSLLLNFSGNWTSVTYHFYFKEMYRRSCFSRSSTSVEQPRVLRTRV